ncbi:hypothetical protein [Spelaeicoccus albus]|uniref:Uncharacterized protein n=1 Tax=Spelaeicoccus albus TaxID=1280376 RepID=A0A7Z0D3N4_9MICO|nr:hypothetical protein [Spelaeicoccus albus]NYI68278.1 hypothetical protein [Spelaeicoccus albus]
MAFDELDSALPTEQAAGHRLDSYWDGLWDPGGGVPWLRKSRADRVQRAGWGRLPATWNVDENEAWSLVFSRRRWLQRLGILGTIQAWRTVTSEQIAAIVGTPWVTQGTSKAMVSFFATGLIDVGEIARGLQPTAGTSSAYLYRPSRTRVFEKKINPKLSYPEQIAPWTKVVNETVARRYIHVVGRARCR